MKYAQEAIAVFGDDASSQFFVVEANRLIDELQQGNSNSDSAGTNPFSLVEDAKTRFRAIEKLASLPLNEPAVPIIEAILGPTKSVVDVLAQLDTSNKDQKSGMLWSVPISEPISQVLDKILETRQP
ncbi:MAG: hypothetical protein ABL921_10045 [Pirellula sp.]